MTIPPPCDVKIWQHGNSNEELWQRIESLRAIRKLGHKLWKQEPGYHWRSLAETVIFRLKTIFGTMLQSCNLEQQAKELFLGVIALNRVTQLGMPESYSLVA